MDPFLTPIKSVRPSGLQIISMRAGRPGLMAGQMSIGIGSAHAANIKPDWVGLPHFLEHLKATGASRRYPQGEARRLLRDKFYLDPNACTGSFETRYFTQDAYRGYVLPARRFWSAFEITSDGTFFSQFDHPTTERERERILEEIAKYTTPLELDDARFRRQLFGVDYMGQNVLGSADQVNGYSQDDCFQLDRLAYALDKTTVVVVGDINHIEAIEKIEDILQDVPTSTPSFPALPKARVQRGEFRRAQEGENPGNVSAYLYFPAVNQAHPQCYATAIAAASLYPIIDDRVKDRFGLYSVGSHYGGNLSGAAVLTLSLSTGNPAKASDALAYIVDIVQDPSTHRLIREGHEDAVERQVTQAEVAQPTVEAQASELNDLNRIGAPLLSFEESVQQFRHVSPEDVAAVLQDLVSAPAFLNVRGHADSLDALPSVDVIDAWRSKPEQRQDGQLTAATRKLAGLEITGQS